MKKKKTALILGATGTIGSALTLSLLKDGWKVYGASRLSDKKIAAKLQKAGANLIRFDVLQDNPKTLPDVDTLFLEIWDPSHPSLIWPVNFYGVGRVVERYAGIADIINGSAINVYGDSPEPAWEKSLCRPTSYYGHTRLAQERLIDYFCSSSGKNCINLRYAHVNTPARGVVRRFAEHLLAGHKISEYPDTRIQVIGLEDIVRMTKDAVKLAANPPFAVNCCHPRIFTHKELAEAIRKVLGKGKILFDHKKGGEEKSAYADVSLMIKLFGEPQIPVETIIARVVKNLGKGNASAV
ncbi:NAD(P)-dependent oxidoreductase [Candidatus Sumerlaeota bacterium]|nr:NAD(P)-dependent oxidoreductase [Candidatus Sumerlaeota bacterium]